MIRLRSCPKSYTRDQDKAVPPEATVARVKQALSRHDEKVLQETRRIDTGRLGIPVYLSVCGQDARRIMPTRKQMGKGASPAQAEASALMELVERYSFFSYMERHAPACSARFSLAAKNCPGSVIALEQILKSVHEDMPREQALRVLDLLEWEFHPATNLSLEREEYIPLAWFKKLGEFNGSSAGNTPEESILQGACELIERHVCDIADSDTPVLPVIRPESITDPVLAELHRKFTQNNIRVLLLDLSLGMPAPTVGAVAMDPASYPGLSEIVYTAGTAASPAKAAIRALTEVAQLGGDFETGAVYEASGLPKLSGPKAMESLAQGPAVALDSLPDIEREDIRDELGLLISGLGDQDFSLYSLDLTNPDLGLPAHYNIAPGFRFRERDRHPSLGLFVGRILAEEAEPEDALKGMAVLKEIYGQAFFLPFFQGLISLRQGDAFSALDQFMEAEPLQPDADKKGLSAFYAGHSLTSMEDWTGAEPFLDRAVEHCPEVKEYFNLRGVCKFKQKRYEDAAVDFSRALDIDRGSAMDLANLGICHAHMGDADKARDFLGAAVELDPSLDFARDKLRELKEI